MTKEIGETIFKWKARHQGNDMQICDIEKYKGYAITGTESRESVDCWVKLYNYWLYCNPYC